MEAIHAWSARSLAPPCCASLQTLEAVATKLGSHAPVAKALCNIFAAAMTAAKQQLAALLGTLCNAIVGMYTAHHHPACLEAIGVAVEVWCHTQPKPTQQATPPQQTTLTHTHTAYQMFGPGADADTQKNLHQLLAAVCKPTFALMTTAKPTDITDILSALYSLAHRFLMHCPRPILLTDLCEPLFKAACACASLQVAPRLVCVVVGLLFHSG